MPMNLVGFQRLQRASFAHRNQGTIVLVIHDPKAAASREAEYEVERLAQGLMHERRFTVSHLDATADSDTSAHVARSLDGAQLPAVLLFPEASPGFLRYKGGTVLDADALLAAVNKCRAALLPNSAPFEMPVLSEEEEEGAAAAAEAAPAGAVDPNGLGSLPSAEVSPPLTVREAEEAGGTAQRGAAAAGGGPAKGVERVAMQAMEPESNNVPPWHQRHANTYWTQPKLLFWGVVAALSVVAFMWDRWLEPRWAEWIEGREGPQEVQEPPTLPPLPPTPSQQ